MIAGVHGANRLGGNSLAEILVFGRLTGATIARRIKTIKAIPLNTLALTTQIAKFTTQLKVRKGKNPLQVKKELMQMMWDCVGVMRERKQMEKALRLLEQFKNTSLKITGSLRMNEQLIAALDVNNMLPTCAMILKSALYRKESRGAHFREDFPYKDTNFRRSTIIKAW